MDKLYAISIYPLALQTYQSHDIFNNAIGIILIDHTFQKCSIVL